MSMEMMKKAAVGAAGAIALLGATGAHAFSTVEYETGTDLSYTTGTSAMDRDFSGPTTLTATVPLFGSIEVDCDLELTGDVSIVSGRAVIEVTSGTVSSGDFLCSQITLGGFPWKSYDVGDVGGTEGVSDTPSPATDPVQGVVDGIEVYIADSDQSDPPACSGYIPVTFSNGSPITADSSFTFDDDIVGSGGCGVDGVLSSPAAYDTNAY